MAKIERALLSVFDKTGLLPFAKLLADAGVELISTGGTAKALRDAGLKVTELSAYTGFPEMLDGRVKTLHPKVHGGLLFVRDNPSHVAAVQQHGIKPIDLVVVNLYPFEQTIAKPNATIQVIPLATVIRTMLGYPITLLCFRVHEVPDAAYIEQLTSALYVHEHQQVSGYGQVLDGLALEALQPAESANYLSRLLCDF